jgi:hypothetical protein
MLNCCFWLKNIQISANTDLTLRPDTKSNINDIETQKNNDFNNFINGVYNYVAISFLITLFLSFLIEKFIVHNLSDVGRYLCVAIYIFLFGLTVYLTFKTDIITSSIFDHKILLICEVICSSMTINFVLYVYNQHPDKKNNALTSLEIIIQSLFYSILIFIVTYIFNRYSSFYIKTIKGLNTINNIIFSVAILFLISTILIGVLYWVAGKYLPKPHKLFFVINMLFLLILLYLSIIETKSTYMQIIHSLSDDMKSKFHLHTVINIYRDFVRIFLEIMQYIMENQSGNGTYKSKT